MQRKSVSSVLGRLFALRFQAFERSGYIGPQSWGTFITSTHYQAIMLLLMGNVPFQLASLCRFLVASLLSRAAGNCKLTSFILLRLRGDTGG